jgi:upstream activation factor subunit UAF30
MLLDFSSLRRRDPPHPVYACVAARAGKVLILSTRGLVEEDVTMSGRTDGKASKGTGQGRRASPALTKPVKPDAQLAAVVGADELPRPEVVKKLWSYIKAEGLQDDQNRRMINADDKLRPLFDGKSQVSMFEMTKLVSKHLS